MFVPKCNFLINSIFTSIYSTLKKIFAELPMIRSEAVDCLALAFADFEVWKLLPVII
jgi:hypothetical protein